MRIRTSIPLLIVCLALGAGCAMSPEQIGERSQHNAYDRYDQDTISRINQDARRQGVDVIWVNPPMKRSSNDGS